VVLKQVTVRLMHVIMGMLIDAEHHNSCCAHVFASQSSITIHVAHMTIHLAHMSLQVRATPPIPHLFLHQDHNESTVCLLLREGSVCQEVSVRKCLSGSVCLKCLSLPACKLPTQMYLFVCWCLCDAPGVVFLFQTVSLTHVTHGILVGVLCIS